MMALDSVDIKRQVRVMMIDGGHRVRAHLNTLGIHIGDWLTVVGDHKRSGSSLCFLGT